MINFLPKSAVEGARWLAVRRGVNLVTTIVLVGYLVAVAGVVGGWVFLDSREEIVSDQVKELSTKVQQLANAEAIVGQVGSRAKMIVDELGGRKSVSEQVGRLANMGSGVEGWEYVGGKQKVTLVGTDLAAMETFARGLKATFSKVEVESAVRRTDNSWQVTVAYE